MPTGVYKRTVKHNAAIAAGQIKRYKDPAEHIKTSIATKEAMNKPEEEQQRINLFAKYGYQTLIIWEHKLKNLEKLIERILKFNLV